MARKRIHRRPPPGSSPGSLVAPEGSPFPVIHATGYNADNIEERTIADTGEIAPFLAKWPVVWIDVQGLGSIEIIEKIGKIFSLHPLALEDVLDPNHRPKTEDYGDYLFTVARMAMLRDAQLDSEHVSIFLGKNYVLTFQEKPGDCFDLIRARLRSGRRIRMLEPDYLAYALLDAIIDGYFPVLGHYGERLDMIEDAIVASPDVDSVTKTHAIRRDLQTIRRDIWPMRETINRLFDDSALVSKETRVFLRDCHDHVIQIVDILETYRERSSGLVDIYLSSISNRTNEIMRLLTMISTIFIPLSFIASLYGMNFDPDASPWNMPELRWVYGYPFALGLMLVTVIGLLIHFRRKGWL